MCAYYLQETLLRKCT